MKKIRTLIENNSHSIIENVEDKELKVISLYTEIAVMPYSIDDSGLLDSVGVVGYTNFYDDTSHLTLLKGFRKDSESSNMITANRLIFDSFGVNITQAEKWMFLGDIYSESSGTPIKLYCVNISNNEDLKSEDFKMVTVNTAITSDDSLLLSSYLRLFKLYYMQGIGGKL